MNTQPAQATAHEDMVVAVTDEACEHIAKQLQQRGKGLGIRLGVKSSGCSGLAYFVEFVDELPALQKSPNVQHGNEICYQKNGINFYVSSEHKVILQDSILLLKKDGLNTGLEFENPNAVGTCGCGESFAVE